MVKNLEILFYRNNKTEPEKEVEGCEKPNSQRTGEVKRETKRITTGEIPKANPFVEKSRIRIFQNTKSLDRLCPDADYLRLTT